MNVLLFSLCVSNRFFAKDFRIFCLEYPSRGSEKGNVYFANYRFSFRKLQIFISFRPISFRSISFRTSSENVSAIIFCVSAIIFQLFKVIMLEKCV